ncbi:MAG: alkaline phosphatase [Acidimicrobiaceae bacterium]|jgi:DeoR family transcriptional regulator of aga operon|nr:alkaline phosphatase [Acidimicrobiaceae bacterium]
MRKVDRFEEILERLSGRGKLAVDEVARDLGVSSATIRRDLAELGAQSLLTRTHGGAVAIEVPYEFPIRYRSGKQPEQKRRIGAAAAALIPDHVVVGISGGTTTTEAARALVGRSGLTVVTNALNIASELTLRPNIRMVVTGGEARAASFELVGSIAEQTIQGYNLDIVLLGVDGIEAKVGCTTHDSTEALTNEAMVRRARKVIVLADSSKIGRVTFAGICGIEDVDVLITDVPSPREPLSNEDGLRTSPEVREVLVELSRLVDAGVEVQQV